MDRLIEPLLEKVRRDDAVLAVLLFGSKAREEETPASDTDLCLVLPPGREDKADQMRVRMEYLDQAGFDVHVFQQLPLYIRHRVLKDGIVLLCKDLDALYAVAYRTAQAFEDFKPIYKEYLEQVARG
jgi:uncharacterized protein